MTAHPIPDNADLVDLVLLNKRWDIEDALDARKSTRPQSRQSYQERALRELRARIGRDVLLNGVKS